MLRMRSFLPLAAALVFLLPSSARAQETKVPATAWAGLLAKADAAEAQGDDMKASMEIVLINKEGAKRLRRAVFFQRGKDKRIIQFKEPKSDAGLTVLVQGEDIHLYLPQLQRVQRIAAHVKNQPFMGTDLSFDDMGSLQYGQTNDVIDAVTTATGYRLTLRGKKGFSKSYDTLQLHLRKEDQQIIQISYFDAKGKEYKRMSRSDFHKKDNFSVPAKLEVKDLTTGHRTLLLLKNLEMNTGLSPRMFSTRYLTRDLEL